MAELTQHVIQRGNNRADIFRSGDDYEFYLTALGDSCRKEQVDVHSYTLMTNHVHLIVTPHKVGGLSVAMQDIGRLYVLYFNRKYKRTGSLYDGRFKSFIIDTESYWFTCMRYVELNPVRAGMVSQPHQYRWSSYASNALGVDDRVLTPHAAYIALGSTPAARQQQWRRICTDALVDEELAEIRRAVQHGGVLGRLLLSEDCVGEVR
jgi:putative transposase